MRFLITGGAGFLGSHVCEALARRGDHAVVLDDLSTGRLENLEPARGHGRVEVCQGKAQDQAVVDRLVATADCVVHLAASVGVKLFHDDAVAAIDNNVTSAAIVLAAAARRGVPTLFASSSEVYGDGTPLPFAEDAPVQLGAPDQMRSGYALSKALGEQLALAHARARRLPVVVARLFNVVGPRQAARYGMVLPRFLDQARTGAPLTVYGDGAQTRCFTHVAEAARALLELAACVSARGQVVNVGSRQECTILALATQVRRALGSRSELVFMPFAQAYSEALADLQRRVPALAKLESLLGWVPSADLARIVGDAAGSAAARVADRKLREQVVGHDDPLRP